MKRYPFCSIIVLNYYGEKIIQETLNSLLNLNYPKNKYEIIVVDNNSKDQSKGILKTYAKNFRQIKTIFLNNNFGFSKGNNIGIKKAKGEYVVLINNDCKADRNWLKELVVSATSDKKIFAASSKILLYPKFIRIRFYINFGLSPVYAWLSKSESLDLSDSKLTYLPLWRKPSNLGFKYKYYEIEIFYSPDTDKTIECTILLNAQGFKLTNKEDLQSFITFENKSVKGVGITQNEDDIEYRISFDTSNLDIRANSSNKVQNAGIMVFQDGYGRDIGSIIRYSQQYYEFDHGQYNKGREVYAACGAAVLYNKKILKKLGYLDDNFFMYYEDLDISERARLIGFKIVYSPKAVVRHHHALSSQEWSPFFIYHAEKGRLLHVFYNFPLRIFLKEYFYLVIKSLINILSVVFRLKTLLYSIRSKKIYGQEPKFIKRVQIVKALCYFILNCPHLLLRRSMYMSKRSRGAINENYSKILKGDWYFS